jgi:hypothetical protein
LGLFLLAPFHKPDRRDLKTDALGSALAYPILSELYDPGKQAKTSEQQVSETVKREFLDTRAVPGQTTGSGWRMSASGQKQTF